MRFYFNYLSINGSHSLLVIMLAFNSHDPSSNPTEACIFFCSMLFEKSKNKQKEAVVGPISKDNLKQPRTSFSDNSRPTWRQLQLTARPSACSRSSGSWVKGSAQPAARDGSIDIINLFAITTPSSVTRLDYLLNFGQFFKACGNNYLVKIANILRQLGIVKVSESFISLVKIIFGQLL